MDTVEFHILSKKKGPIEWGLYINKFYKLECKT